MSSRIAAKASSSRPIRPSKRMSDRLDGPELDVGADRADRQVAVQARGDDGPMLAAVGLQQLERALDVGHERALADRHVAVVEGDRVLGHVARRPRRPAGASRGGGSPVGEHGVDRRRQAAGEEGGDVEREQQVHGVPVAAADRAVAAQVLDRLGREQAALVAVEGDEDRPQVAVQREAVADAEQRVHVPAEAQRPRVLGDRLVHRGVAVDGDDVQLGLDVVQAALGPRALAQALEQAGELVAAVQPDALVADEVAERGDALDVVAEVGRGAVGARVAVVDDRERASPGGGARSASPGRRRSTAASSRACGRPRPTGSRPRARGGRSARRSAARARSRRSRRPARACRTRTSTRTSGGSSATSERSSASASPGATARPERTYSETAKRVQASRGTGRSRSQASSA